MKPAKSTMPVLKQIIQLIPAYWVPKLAREHEPGHKGFVAAFMLKALSRPAGSSGCRTSRRRRGRGARNTRPR